MAGLIRKAIRGAAQAGVPMLMEEYRNQNLAKRDARLQEYVQQNQGAQQRFQTQERQAGQEFTAEQNQLTREQQQGQFESEMEASQQDRSLRHQQVKQQIRAADLALEDAQLSLSDKKEIRGIRSVLMDSNASAEEKQLAAEELGILLGEGSPELRAVTIYSEPNDFGEQTRQTVLVNPITGQGEPITVRGTERRDDDPLGILGTVNWKDLPDGGSQSTPAVTVPKEQESSNQTPAPSEAAPQEDLPTTQDSSAVLEGYTLPTSLLQTIRESSAEARAFNEQQRKEREEQQRNSEQQQGAAAAEEIANILESRDLRPLSRTEVRRKVKQAIDTGNLTDEQVRILTAAYERIGIKL